jgi:FkbM family methyltransferase
MNDLLTCLSGLPQQPLGTIVHVGAGSGAVVADYATLAPRRVVLIEGDPDNAADLRTAARNCAWAEVVECIVAAEAGEALWHRFDLPRFNGLRVPARLGAHYPRLRELGTATVATTALASLAALNEPARKDAADVLVLDLPGQEGALLAAVPSGLLHRFPWIVVRACAIDDDTEDAAGERIADALKPHCFRPARSRVDADAAWPLLLFQLDTARLRNERLRAKVSTLEEQAKQQQRELRQFAAERDLLAEASVKDKGRLRAERDELAERTRQLAQQVEALQAGIEERDRRIAEFDQRFEQQAAEHRDVAARQILLQEELARAEGQLDTLRAVLLREAEP